MSDQQNAGPGRNLSHGHGILPFEQTVEQKRAEIKERGDLADATVDEQLDLLEQLLEFPFGRFLLHNRGWNGFWTDFVVEHPAGGRVSGKAPNGRPLTNLEQRMLDTFPMIIATQERSRHFAAAIQHSVVDSAALASIPCGLMRDLLGRDFSVVSDVRLVGVDLDDESLLHATHLADETGMAASTTFLKEDAWDLGFHDEFDLIASNGLNTYEPDDGRVTDLYRRFHAALRPGGVLVTSFLTPPPESDPASEWKMDAIDPKALRMQKLLFVDIVGVAFQCYRDSAATKAQLAEAGFQASEVIWDRAGIYPTVVARKG